jgi:hypothetical protein
VRGHTRPTDEATDERTRQAGSDDEDEQIFAAAQIRHTLAQRQHRGGPQERLD